MSVTKTDSEITLYGCPHACSLVSHLALETAGADFRVNWRNLLEKEHLKPEYLAISPRGKVPLLVTPEGKVSENVAILVWINNRYPEAGLLPDYSSSAFVQAISDLSWFSSGIHPHLSRTMVPTRFVSQKSSIDDVQAMGMTALVKELKIIDQRLEGRDWWGDAHSALDFYPFWLWARSGESDLDQSPFKNYRAFVKRMLTLPTVTTVLERERQFMDCFASLENL